MVSDDQSEDGDIDVIPGIYPTPIEYAQNKVNLSRINVVPDSNVDISYSNFTETNYPQK